MPVYDEATPTAAALAFKETTILFAPVLVVKSINIYIFPVVVPCEPTSVIAYPAYVTPVH